MCVVGVQDDETLVAVGQGGGAEDQPHEQNEVKTFHRKGIEFMKTGMEERQGESESSPAHTGNRTTAISEQCGFVLQRDAPRGDPLPVLRADTP